MRDVFEDKTVIIIIIIDIGGLSSDSDWTVLARNQRLPKEVFGLGIRVGEIRVGEIREQCEIESVGFIVGNNWGWNYRVRK